MDVLVSCLVAACFVNLIGFWTLYLTVVRPRVEMAHGLDALRMRGPIRWPFEALDAYRALLSPDERGRWNNRWVRVAFPLQVVLMLALFAIVFGGIALG